MGWVNATFSSRLAVMVMAPRATSARPDCTAANSMLNGIDENSTDLFRRWATAWITSTSKPVSLPLRSSNSKGGLPWLTATRRSAARLAVAARERQAATAGVVHMLFIPSPWEARLSLW